jgi:hypothetical protein
MIWGLGFLMMVFYYDAVPMDNHVIVMMLSTFVGWLQELILSSPLGLGILWAKFSLAVWILMEIVRDLFSLGAVHTPIRGLPLLQSEFFGSRE